MSACALRPTIRDSLDDAAFDLNIERKLEKKMRNEFEAERKACANNWHTPGRECQRGPLVEQQEGKTQAMGAFTCQAWTSTVGAGGYMSSERQGLLDLLQRISKKQCIVFLGWTSLTKTGNWEEQHAFTRRTASYTFDGLRARGFLFIQLEELWAGTIRGETEARGMNLRQLQEIDQEVWTESPEINSREKKREREETPERSRTF